MKRAILSLILYLLLLPVLKPQEVYITHRGIASFTSNAPLEIIKATTDQLQGAMDLSDRSFIFSIDNKTFKGFNSSLQQEHFYENYMEIQKYPLSTFKGKIIEEVNLASTAEQSLRAKGTLEIHGVEQERIIRGTLKRTGDKLIIHADFTVPLEDHNIKIPRIVYQKIAETIDVSVSVELTKKYD